MLRSSEFSHFEVPATGTDNCATGTEDPAFALTMIDLMAIQTEEAISLQPSQPQPH
jgi:hypothetical protein